MLNMNVARGLENPEAKTTPKAMQGKSAQAITSPHHRQQPSTSKLTAPQLGGVPYCINLHQIAVLVHIST